MYPAEDSKILQVAHWSLSALLSHMKAKSNFLALPFGDDGLLLTIKYLLAQNGFDLDEDFLSGKDQWGQSLVTFGDYKQAEAALCEEKLKLRNLGPLIR